MATATGASRRLHWDDAAWTCVGPDLCVRCGAPALTLDNRGALADDCGNFYVGHEEWLRSGCSRPYQYQPLGEHHDVRQQQQEQQQVSPATVTKKKKKKKPNDSSSSDSDSSSSSSSSDSSTSDPSDSSSSSSSDSSSNSSSSSSDSSASSSDAAREVSRSKPKKSAKVREAPVLPSSEPKSHGLRDYPASAVSRVVRPEPARKSESSEEKEVRQVSSKVVRCEVRDSSEGEESSNDDDYSSHTLTSKLVRVRPREIINWEEDVHEKERKNVRHVKQS